MSSAVATPTQPTMRTPEYNQSGPNRREGKTFENEYFQYLSPESFTVLPPEGGASPVAGGLPSPPKAPEPYKLTPRSKRHKQQSFAIIAETGGLSAPSSRAGSPTGRVSPFRGRGFNPTGSRHASPAPSPPPGDMSDDAILRQSKEMVNQLRKSSIGRSQIPVLLHRRDRRSSAEDILSPDPDTSPPEGSPTNLQLQSRYSQSMINIAPRNLSKKPPPSPRRSNLKPSFVRLSPIIGSSPEAGSDHMSSPSKIPKTRSQPPSRAQSPSRVLSPSDRQRNVRTPTRTPSRTPARTPSRTPSRNPSRTPVRNSVSRPASRNGSTSREPSPGRSPSKIPMNKSAYKNIPAKVETFSRVSASSKPKVPQKPKVYSTRTNLDRSNSTRKSVNKSISNSRSPRKDLEDTETTDTEKEPIRNRRQSISNYNSVSRRNSISKPSTSGYKQQSRKQQDAEKSSTSRNNKTTTSDSYDRSSTSTVVGKTTKGMGSRTSSQTFKRDDGAKDNRHRRNDTTTATSTTEELSKTEDETTEDGKDDDILSVTIDEFMGSQTTKIVSATAETVVKPLNIEAKLVKQSEADEIASTTTTNTTGNKNSSSVHSTIKRGTSQASMNVNKPAENSGTNNKINNNGASKNITDSTTHTNKQVNPGNNTSDQSTKQSSNISSNPASNLSSNPSTNPSSNPPSNLPSNIPSNQVSNHSPPVNGALPTSQSNSPPPDQNNLKHMSSHNSLTPSIDMNVKNNLNNLTPPDSDKVSSKSLMDSSPLTNSARVKQRTVIVDEIKPIKITVREKSGDVEVQSGNYALPRSATNGIAERPHLPPSNNPVAGAPPDPPADSKPHPCSKLFSCCKKKPQEAASMSGSSSGVQVMPEAAHEGHEGDKPPSRWSMCCKGKGKVGDSNSGGKGCFPKLKKNKEDNWAERRDSILSEPPKKTSFSQTLRKIFCSPCVKCKKKPDESVSRRTSMMSKKKSLSSTMQPPPEKKDKKKENANVVVKDTGPKLEASLVEHASHMRGAIPVLPVPLAWICLICNVFLPGFGTILSGLLCLCIGIPRFSPRDSAKARFGAFLIDVIVGISQCFTVLFCLVGWGWSIWWGVIMLKIARKHRRIKLAEETAIEDIAVPTVNVNNRDVERGT